MTNIHLVGGEKGGVGKSLVARLLAQYMIDHSIPFLGFDSDRSHGALLRFYAGYASPILIDNYESLDAIVEAADRESGAAHPGRSGGADQRAADAVDGRLAIAGSRAGNRPQHPLLACHGFRAGIPSTC